MNKFRIWSLAAAVPLMASCGLLDSIESQINDAVGSLTAVTQGNLTELVGANADTMKSASQQLEQLKTGAKPTSEGAPSGFSLGTAPGLRSQNALADAISDSLSCAEITREDDLENKIRKIITDFSGCEDQAGTITSTLEESASGQELMMEYTDYISGKRKTNGIMTWTITLASDFKTVTISANQQLSIVTGTTAVSAKMTPLQDEETPTVTPVSVGGTINYTINPEVGELKISGTSTYSQGAAASSINFTNIVFDFDIDGEEGEDTGCDKGPSEGSVSMNGTEGALTITVTGCGVATKDDKGVAVEVSEADLKNIFKDTLTALVEFFVAIDNVVIAEFSGSECSESDLSVVNGTQATAQNISITNKVGKLTKINFNGEMYFKASLDAGNQVVLATPESCSSLWPFICVTDSDGTPLGAPCDETSFNVGWYTFTLSQQKDVFIHLYDPWEDYQCQILTIDVFDETAQNIEPAICTDAGATNPDGPITEECPLFWIGDGICDLYCLNSGIWTSTSTNPDNGKVAGTDDAGDCGENALPCEPGYGMCWVANYWVDPATYAPAYSTCVMLPPPGDPMPEQCGTSYCGPDEVAVFDPYYGEIFCYYTGP